MFIILFRILGLNTSFLVCQTSNSKINELAATKLTKLEEI